MLLTLSRDLASPQSGSGDSTSQRELGPTASYVMQRVHSRVRFGLRLRWNGWSNEASRAQEGGADGAFARVRNREGNPSAVRPVVGRKPEEHSPGTCTRAPQSSAQAPSRLNRETTGESAFSNECPRRQNHIFRRKRNYLNRLLQRNDIASLNGKDLIIPARISADAQRERGAR